MTTHELLDTIFGESDDALAAQCGRWMDASKPFRLFVAAYQAKIRKKVRSLRDDEGRADVLFELAIAYRLLQERRFILEYEKYGVGRQRGPDFTVTYKTHTVFNVEVKRLRAAAGAPRPQEHHELYKLTNAICAKLWQMLPGAPNVLALGAEGEGYGENEIEQATRLLKRHADQKDDIFFARWGFASARDFVHSYQRLGMVAISSLDAQATDPAALWANREAQHPIPSDLSTILRRLL
jgi:hypothetical protein